MALLIMAIKMIVSEYIKFVTWKPKEPIFTKNIYIYKYTKTM